MPDCAETRRWENIVAALRERAEACGRRGGYYLGEIDMRPRLAHAPLTVAPLHPASLESVHAALLAVAGSSLWFDKAAFDAELAECGASDGALHDAADWDMEHWEYPDDPSPKSSTRGFGPGSLLRSLVTAPYRPASATPTGSAEARVYMEFAEEALGLLRHVRVPLEPSDGIVPARWGGPAGDEANRCPAMAWRMDCRTTWGSGDSEYAVGAGECVGIALRPEWTYFAAWSKRSGECQGHSQWLASAAESRHYDDASGQPEGAFWISNVQVDTFALAYSHYTEDGTEYSSQVIPATLEFQQSPTAVDPPGALGLAYRYPIVSARRWDDGNDRYEYAPVVDPGLKFRASPAKFQFTAPCAGRLLLHVCAPGLNAVSRDDPGVWSRHTFDGGGVWAMGWNTFAVRKGVNVLDRPHLPGAP